MEQPISTGTNDTVVNTAIDPEPCSASRPDRKTIGDRTHGSPDDVILVVKCLGALPVNRNTFEDGRRAPPANGKMSLEVRK